MMKRALLAILILATGTTVFLRAPQRDGECPKELATQTSAWQIQTLNHRNRLRGQQFFERWTKPNNCWPRSRAARADNNWRKFCPARRWKIFPPLRASSCWRTRLQLDHDR